MAENEYLKQQFDLVVDRIAIESGGTPEYLHLRELFGQIKRLIQEANIEINDLLLAAGLTGVIYFGVPDQNGEYSDSTWRIRIGSDGYNVEQNQAGSWVTIFNAVDSGTFTALGWGAASVVIDSDYTVPNNVYNVTCNATSSIAITPPPLAGRRSLRLTVNEGAQNVTFLGTVNGVSNPVFFAGETADLTDDGTGWRV